MSRPQRTPFVILGLLALSGRKALSGYEITKMIARVVSSFWHESEGQIYPAMERLAAAGAIAVRQETRQGRRKKLYALTPKGRKQLRAWLAGAVEVGRPRDELMLKLFFGSEAEIPDLIRHVRAHRARMEAQLAQCREWESEARQDARPYRRFVDLTLQAGMKLSEAHLQWADETLLRLSAMAEPDSLSPRTP